MGEPRRRCDHDDPARQVNGLPGAWRPPADALVAARLHAQRLRLARAAVHVRDPGRRCAAQGDGDVGGDPLAGALAVRAVPARPAAIPELAAGLEHAHARRLRDRHPGGPGRDPARASRRRSTATRASTRGRRSVPARAARSSCARRTRCRSTPTSTCTAATCPAAHDGHPMDVIAGRRPSTTTTRTTRTRRCSGTTTTRTAARRRRSTTASSGCTCSRTSARRSSGCRRASTTCRS